MVWDSASSSRLESCNAHAIIAIIGDGRVANSWFGSIQEQPISIPILSVLPSDVPLPCLQLAAKASTDFMFEPLRGDELMQRLKRILGESRDDESTLRRLSAVVGLSHFIGEDPLFIKTIHMIPRLAESDSPVVITGETGTGKELCARAIHHLSRRRDMPFVAVDCGTVPDHLFENEFFGHTRGAFTDARSDSRGLVAMAEGGTLFLDEVDALSLSAQAKLLRLIQERTYRSLGGDRFLHADVHVIAATNRLLEDCLREKTFRSDLYYRLNVLRLELPPLRERRKDILPLSQHFLESCTRGQSNKRKAFSQAAIALLMKYHWPGNVRELANVVQRAAWLSNGGTIQPSDIAITVAGESPSKAGGTFRDARARVLEMFERDYVAELLQKHGGNITRAAREAQKERRSFGRLVKKHRIHAGSSGPAGQV